MNTRRPRCTSGSSITPWPASASLRRDRPRGPLVPTLRPVLPCRRGAPHRVRCPGRPRHDLPVGPALHAAAGRAPRPRRHAVADRWQVDETYVKVAGQGASDAQLPGPPAMGPAGCLTSLAGALANEAPCDRSRRGRRREQALRAHAGRASMRPAWDVPKGARTEGSARRHGAAARHGSVCTARRPGSEGAESRWQWKAAATAWLGRAVAEEQEPVLLTGRT